MIIIERFEENIAVLEDGDNGKSIEVDRNILPHNAKEGDVLELSDGCYLVNSEETEKRRKAVIERLRKLGL